MSEPVQVTAGGVRWQVLPELSKQLLGPQGLRLDEWLNTGRARVVKHGPHRTVYRVDLPGLNFYLKHYRLADVRAWLRELVRPSKARMEYQRALAVAEGQVPSISPLAVGESGAGVRPGESFLITRALEDTEPLSAFIETTVPQFEPPRQARIRQRLAGAVGRLIARMHDAGMIHNDLHAANLLVRLGPDDQPELYVIDLHAVSLGGPLSWRASRANLVMLNRWFVLRVGRADRLRFWRAYCQARKTAARVGQAAMRPLARDLERRTWESNWRFWRNRDRRCLANNRYYRRVRSAAAVGYAVTDLDHAALAELLADPDAPFQRPNAVLLKDSRSTTVAELDLPVGGVLRRVIYKRFRVTTWSDPWTALVRRSPALRSWVHGHGLRERCLPTPRPLAVFHRRRHGLSGEGYLITEKIPDAIDLRRFVDDLASLAPHARRAVLRRQIDQVARLVRELHRRRLSHRDLKAANVLISGIRDQGSGIRDQGSGIRDQGSGIRKDRDPSFLIPDARSLIPALWLIDLVGVTNHHKLPRRRRVQNLTRLHASFAQDASLTRTDRLRFLRVYLEWGLLGRTGWKLWWKEIEQATRAKVARNRRNGRPLA